MIPITNQEFLKTLAAACPEGSFLWTCFFAGDPNASKMWAGMQRAPNGGSRPQNLDERPMCDLNTYFSVGAFKPDDSGEIKRQKSHFSRLLCLVVDDVNLDELNGPVSYVLRTSPGKSQAGIFLDAEDPDCKDIELCTALVTRMIEGGKVGDQAGNAVTRYMRLPVGQNQKPRESGNFVHELTQWSPDVRMTLAEAAAVVGFDLEEILSNPKQLHELSRERQVPEHRVAVELDQAVGQAEKLQVLTQNILGGVKLHDSINHLAASMIAGGAGGGTVVNQLRALMNASKAPRDERWKGRYNDIDRAVTTAEVKFRRERVEAAMAGGRFQANGDQVIAAGDKERPLLSIAGALVAEVKAPRWIVKGLLEADALGLMYGAPGDGKSFLAIDIACSVATGTPWHDRKVRKGPVIYIAGEGLGGISRRLQAWQKDRGVGLDGAPLYVSNRAVSLLTAESALQVVEKIEAALPEDSPPPALVVIDTVARAFVGGDENSSQDISLFINVIDTLLKGRWGAHVLLVHHSGKDAIKGARGSSALKGALDQEFAVERHISARKLSCTKMKDAETPAELAFKLRGVELARLIDEFGEETTITSAVVEMLEAAEAPVARRKGGAERDSVKELSPAALVEIIRSEGWPGPTSPRI